MTMAQSCIMEGELLFKTTELQHSHVSLGLLFKYFMYLPFRYAFSEDGGPTIIPKPDPYIPIGQRDGPSLLDLHKINVLYNCGK